MKVCACVLLFTVFAHTNTKKQPEDPDRNINLDLDTVVEFNKQEHLNNVQQFINRVKDAMNIGGSARWQLRAGADDTFTDFLQQAIDTITTYDDNTLRMFITILDKELRNYNYRGCKFQELTDNFETTTFLSKKLDLIKDKPVSETRSIINSLGDALRDQKYDSKVKDFLKYVNSLYREDGGLKFNKVLKNLKFYGGTKSWTDDDLVKVIREAVRALIFDHYTDLNLNTRRELREKIAYVWNNSKAYPRTVLRTNFFAYNGTSKRNSAKTTNVSIDATDKKNTSKPRHELKENIIAKIKPTLNELYKHVSASNIKYISSDESVITNSVENSQEKRRFVKSNIQKHLLKSERHDSGTTVHTFYFNVTSEPIFKKEKPEKRSFRRAVSFSTIEEEDTSVEPRSGKDGITPQNRIKFQAFLDYFDAVPPTTTFVRRHVNDRTTHDQTKTTSTHLHSHEALSVEQFQQDLETERNHLRKSLSNNMDKVGTLHQIIIDRLNYLEKQIEELKQAHALRDCPTYDNNRNKCITTSSSDRDQKYGDTSLRQGKKPKYNTADDTSDIIIKRCDKCNTSRIYRKILKTEVNKTMFLDQTLNATVNKHGNMFMTTPNVKMHDEEMNPQHHHHNNMGYTKTRQFHANRESSHEDQRILRSGVNLTLATESGYKINRDFNKTFPLDASYVTTDARKFKDNIGTKKEVSDTKSESNTDKDRARSKRVLEYTSPPRYDNIF